MYLKLCGHIKLPRTAAYDVLHQWTTFLWSGGYRSGCVSHHAIRLAPGLASKESSRGHCRRWWNAICQAKCPAVTGVGPRRTAGPYHPLCYASPLYPLGPRSAKSMGSHYKNKFILRVTEVQPYVKLTWKTDEPVWVNQWPLKAERLHKLHGLVQEQLRAGHVVPSTSPWNTPVFVIPKKSGKW